MNSKLQARLESTLSPEATARYIREIDEAQKQYDTMRRYIHEHLPNARILLIDSSPRTQADVLEWHKDIPEAQVEALAATECTTVENESTAQRVASKFGLQLTDPQLIRWHAPFETPTTSLDEIDAIILTGSSAMVTDAPETPWMQRIIAVLQEAREKKIPMLGICFGHQIMAQAFGGEVDWMVDAAGQRIQEFGPVFMEYTPEGPADELFAGLNETNVDENATTKQGFWVQSAHSQHVTVQPPETTVLAKTNLSPIQALAYKNAPMWSIQNHPEYTAVLLDILASNNPETPPEVIQKNITQDTFAARTYIFANFLHFVARYRK